jgi:hypothetical protein
MNSKRSHLFKKYQFLCLNIYNIKYQANKPKPQLKTIVKNVHFCSLGVHFRIVLIVNFREIQGVIGKK